MTELLVFCRPRIKTYIHQPPEEVAKEYEGMAIEDFDNFVKFTKEYDEIKEIADFSSIINKKENLNLYLTLFFKQPVTNIGSIKENLISSSYLFNPLFYKNGSQLSDLYFPDLDVVQIKGLSRVESAAEAMKHFYESYGWKTHIFDGRINDLIQIMPNPDSRQKGPIEIFNPKTLRELAHELIGYDLNKLYFNKD